LQQQQQQQQQHQQHTSGPHNKEDLLLEIKRLRERIRGLESDNAALHLKMSRAQKDVDQVIQNRFLAQRLFFDLSDTCLNII
jgi:hypothetical protein